MKWYDIKHIRKKCKKCAEDVLCKGLCSYHYNKEHRKEYNKREDVINKRREKDKQSYKKLKQNTEKYEEYKNQRKIYMENYYKQNKEKHKKHNKEYRLENYDKIKKQTVKYNKKNREKIQNKMRNKYKNDVNYKIITCLRNRFKQYMRRSNDNKNVIELLGCSIEEFRIYIEKQFKENMNWNNYGLKGWHMDHIIPCNRFDLSKTDEQKKCFHYTNLQPLWCDKNWKKK